MSRIRSACRARRRIRAPDIHRIVDPIAHGCRIRVRPQGQDRRARPVRRPRRSLFKGIGWTVTPRARLTSLPRRRGPTLGLNEIYQSVAGEDDERGSLRLVRGCGRCHAGCRILVFTRWESTQRKAHAGPRRTSSRRDNAIKVHRPEGHADIILPYLSLAQRGRSLQRHVNATATNRSRTPIFHADVFLRSVEKHQHASCEGDVHFRRPRSGA